MANLAFPQEKCNLIVEVFSERLEFPALVRWPDSRRLPPSSETLGTAGGTGGSVDGRSMSVIEMFRQLHSNHLDWSGSYAIKIRTLEDGSPKRTTLRVLSFRGFTVT
jgi:hypothetical protein